jgi:hypothetical protein
VADAVDVVKMGIKLKDVGKVFSHWSNKQIRWD